MTRALIHVPTEDYEAYADCCMDYINERGYEFVGIVRGGYDKVKSVFDRDGATVAIVATEAYLDPNRKGRVEVARKSRNERADADIPSGSPRQQRPHRI